MVSEERKENGSLRETIYRMDERLKAVREDLVAIKEDIKDIKTRIDSQDSRIDEIDKRSEANKSRIANLEDDMRTVKKVSWGSGFTALLSFIAGKWGGGQ